MSVRVKSEPDSSTDDDGVTEVKAETVRATVVVAETIDVLDDDSNVAGPSGSDVENGGRRRSRRSIPKKDYAEDSEDEEKQIGMNRRQRSENYTFHGWDIPRLKMNHFKLDQNIKHVSFTNAHTIRLQDFADFCDANRDNIESVTLDNGVSMHHMREIASRLYKLEALTLECRGNLNPIGNSPELDAPCRNFVFGKNLVKVSLHGTNRCWLDDQQNCRKLLLSSPKTLEQLHYTFGPSEDISMFLKALTAAKLDLKCLTIASRQPEDEDSVLLHQEDIQLLASLNCNLRTLQLNCGIWEDVSAADLTNLLTKFATTLQHFTIAENLQGVDLADRQLKLNVPPMKELLSFSMGSIYDFEEEHVDDDDSLRLPRDPLVTRQAVNSARSQDAGIISLDKPGLIAIDISFHPIPTLLSLSLGNLIHIESISPEMFPQLRTLHIGSNWTLTLNIPTPTAEALQSAQFPVFSLVRELQLPDFLQDEFFMLNIQRMFPSLKKVKMQFPTMKCLRYFFHAMANAPTHLHTLHLKTSCDFKGMLENALFPRSAHPAVREDYNLEKLFKLENHQQGNKMFTEFVREKGIEIPIWAQTLDDDIINGKKFGIEALTELKTLILGHLPRTIKIPTDNTISYKNHQQIFRSNCKIGFHEYPLSKHFLKKDLRKLRNLEKFRHGTNFGTINYKLFNQVTYEGQGSCTYRNINSRNYDSSDGEFEDYSGLALGVSESSSAGRNNKRKFKVTRQSVVHSQVKVKKEEGMNDVKPCIKKEVKQEVKNEA